MFRYLMGQMKYFMTQVYEKAPAYPSKSRKSLTSIFSMVVFKA